MVGVDHLAVALLHLGVLLHSAKRGQLGSADLVLMLEVEVNDDNSERGADPAELQK